MHAWCTTQNLSLLGELVVEGLNQAIKLLKAEFDSDDRPNVIPQKACNALSPLVLPNGATSTAEAVEANALRLGQRSAMLGSSEFWRICSHRAHSNAQFVGDCAVYVARHCVEYARSSGGWVYVGDLIRTMTSGGITHATTALASHGLTILPSGELDALSIKADDILVLDGTELMEHWQSFLSPDASHDTVADEENGDIVISTDRAERASRPMPVFFGACQGHSCLPAA
eukprot:5797123-Pyramimonas_sp.AAC.1